MTPLAVKVLGPSCDYLGAQIKLLTQSGVENIQRILESAERKLPDQMLSNGSVPPKVLKKVIFDGSFNDDAITQEYFGGVLASSKNENRKDDRGAYLLNLVSDLSAYQIRAHFLLYSVFHQLFAKRKFDEAITQKFLSGLPMFLDVSSLIKGMDFNEEEQLNLESLCTHIVYGLSKESLIDKFAIDLNGSTFTSATLGCNHSNRGIVVTPSPLGIELFMWAIGKGRAPLSSFFTQLEYENFNILEDVHYCWTGQLNYLLKSK